MRPSLGAGLALVSLATTYARQITLSSRPFDPAVSNCAAAGGPPPRQPSPPPPMPPASLPPELALPETEEDCGTSFQWIELGRSNGAIHARIDISGAGLSEGWLMRIDFAGKNATRVQIGDLVGAELLHEGSGGAGGHGIVLLRARLAAGLGTVSLSLRNLPRRSSAAPAISCFRAPPREDDDEDDGHAEEAEEVAAGRGGGSGARRRSGGWRQRARVDFRWMATEFNRQYLSSHGKPTHVDYGPAQESAALTHVHFLNGRLWCFFGAVSNATRSLAEVVAREPDHLLAHLLLAKIYIGQGHHLAALQALDRAIALQPHHWQSHLLRLHCLHRRGRLASAEAASSHRAVCGHVREAAREAGALDAADLVCREGCVMLDDDASPADAHALPVPRVRRGAGSRPGELEGAAAAPGDEGARLRGRFGAQLHLAHAREELARDRYTVVRSLLPARLHALLRGWYRHLRRDVGRHAAFQAKTARHEYLPEVISTYLNSALAPLVSQLSGITVAPTYPFPITYVAGGGIHPHLDVADNELSLTFQVELEGGGASSWPLLFLDPRGRQLNNLSAADARTVLLDDNDGVLYYGPDVVHWRQPQASQLTQVVFAWRREDVRHCNIQ